MFKNGNIPWNKGKNNLQVAWNKGKKWDKKIIEKIRISNSISQLEKKLSTETKRKMSESRIGKKLSDETKKNISLAKKGKPNGHKGLKRSAETKKKMSLAHKGNKNHLGFKHSDETKKKMSEWQKGKPSSVLGKHWKLSNETKIKMSEARKGNKHYNWQGGISFEPYGLEFNEDLKKVIRNRDRRKCQICEKTELDGSKKLCIHHIDYNKKNNDPKNLISLCVNCHTKTNYNREYWISYFKKYYCVSI